MSTDPTTLNIAMQRAVHSTDDFISQRERSITNRRASIARASEVLRTAAQESQSRDVTDTDGRPRGGGNRPKGGRPTGGGNTTPDALLARAQQRNREIAEERARRENERARAEAERVRREAATRAVTEADMESIGSHDRGSDRDVPDLP